MNTILKIRIHGSILSIAFFCIFLMIWSTGNQPIEVLPTWLYVPITCWFILHLITCIIVGNGNPFHVPEETEEEKK